MDDNGRGHADLWRTAVPWPIAERYELDERETDITGAQIRRVVPRGPAKGHWVPAADPDLAGKMANLARASDSEILEWVTSRGLLGLHRDASLGESIAEIREQVTHLRACRALYQALIDRPDGAVVRELAIQAAGHLDDAEHIWRGLGLAPWEPSQRRGVGTDAQALHALGDALVWPLQRFTWVLPRVWATQRRLGLEPQLVGSGPIGVAYLQLLEAASRLVVDHRAGTQRLDWRGVPRQCAGCGQSFLPRQESQAYHDERCRWKAQKDRQRAKERRP